MTVVNFFRLYHNHKSSKPVKYCGEINIDEIPGSDETAAVIEIALSKEETSVNKENIVALEGYYTFDYQGERISGEVKIEISIRRIVDVSETEGRLLEF